MGDSTIVAVKIAHNMKVQIADRNPKNGKCQIIFPRVFMVAKIIKKIQKATFMLLIFMLLFKMNISL